MLLIYTMLVYHFVDLKLGIEIFLGNRGPEEKSGFDFEIGA